VTRSRETAGWIEDRLARWPVARLATIAHDGRPRLVPCVFARLDDALWTPVDGKPKRADGTPGRELARIADLRRDARATLLLDEYDADWTRLWWIRVDGRARIHRSDDPDADPRFAAAAAALRAKYPQYETTPLFGGVPTLIEVARLRVASWRADPGGD